MSANSAYPTLLGWGRGLRAPRSQPTQLCPRAGRSHRPNWTHDQQGHRGPLVDGPGRISSPRRPDSCFGGDCRPLGIQVLRSPPLGIAPRLHLIPPQSIAQSCPARSPPLELGVALLEEGGDALLLVLRAVNGTDEKRLE